LSKQEVFGPFLSKRTATSIVYLDMFEKFHTPVLHEDPNNMLFQQDQAPSHFHNKIADFLNIFPEKWI
jgi:hypothetical protein